jgi:hypothetical protein
LVLAAAPHWSGAAAEPADPSATRVAEASPNGFSFEQHTVERARIISGGPPRDGIPSVDAPSFAPIGEARWVRADTPVIGVVLKGEARAYPVHAMEYHQVVNDVIAGQPVVVTYDPLTDSGIAYLRPAVENGGGSSKTLEFGVSGLVYNSNFLLYDRQSESLWSQFLGKALAGPRAGQVLVRIPTRTETTAAWLARHPESGVMELPERRRFDYRYSNYTSYWTSEEVVFPVAVRDTRFHPKELVLGARVGDHSRAYVGSIVTRAGARIVDEIVGRKIRIEYDGDSGTFTYEAPDDVEVTTAYWFAWKAFNPETEVWSPGSPSPSQ